MFTDGELSVIWGVYGLNLILMITLSVRDYRRFVTRRQLVWRLRSEGGQDDLRKASESAVKSAIMSALFACFAVMSIAYAVMALLADSLVPFVLGWIPMLIACVVAFLAWKSRATLALRL